jgi:hypothetical protein
MKTSKIPNSVGFSTTDGQIKRVVRLNIGLNNNPLGHSPVAITNALGLYVDVDSASVQTGKWEGADEPTLVVTALTTDSLEDFSQYISELSQSLTQDAIAFRYGGKGVLQYRQDYSGDERHEFSDEYFI